MILLNLNHYLLFYVPLGGLDEVCHSTKTAKSGHACVLDGDMRKKENKDHGLLYPPQDGLYFLYGDSPPEKFLCDLYERAHGDQGFRYHIDQSNVHSLFGKMVEVYGIEDKRAAFEACWEEFAKSDEGKVEIDEIVKFILSQCRKYSPDL